MKYSIIALLGVFLCGCATIFNGSRAPVTVRSEDPQAKIYIDNQYVGQGSGTISVAKKGQHTITVVKEGCGDGSAAITKSFDATSLLGIFLDLGIFSMGIVDGASTGAISDIEPRYYTVNPTCGAARNTATEKEGQPKPR